MLWECFDIWLFYEKKRLAALEYTKEHEFLGVQKCACAETRVHMRAQGNDVSVESSAAVGCSSKFTPKHIAFLKQCFSEWALVSSRYIIFCYSEDIRVEVVIFILELLQSFACLTNHLNWKGLIPTCTCLSVTQKCQGTRRFSWRVLVICPLLLNCILTKP